MADTHEADGTLVPAKRKCLATRRDGTPCPNRHALPEGLHGNGYCAFHGGYNKLNEHLKLLGMPPQQAQTRTHTGLYSHALRATLRDARQQAIFDDPSVVKIDLKPEIALWRAKVVGWQTDMLAGKVYFESNKGQPVLYEELIKEGTKLLNRMLELQAKLHPNEAASGELTINIKMAGADLSKEDMPDLEADSRPQPLVPTNGDPAPRGATEDVHPLVAAFGGDD